MDKLVTIGLPVRNGADRVEKTIEYLLAQTYKNIELIISDNDSTDETGRICEEISSKDRRIKYFRQPENIGFVKNCAFLLSKANGEYFMWASHDDWWHESFVEKMVRALGEDSKYGAAMSHFGVIRDGREGILPTPGGEHNYTQASHYEVFKKMMKAKANPIYEFALYRTKVLRKIFSRLKPKCMEDTQILISEASLATRFYSVPELLHAKYRNPRPLRERHYLGEYYKDPYARTRYLYTMLTWFLTSPAIPIWRKILVFGPWFSRFWHFKRKIYNEIRAAV